MKIKVCVVQDSPIFFDKGKTIEKIEAIAEKYADEGCKLIVFPESFIPGYPRGFSFGATIGKRTDEGRELYAKYYKNSIDVKSEDLTKLEALSKSKNIYLVIGVTEKENLNGSLYCSTASVGTAQCRPLAVTSTPFHGCPLSPFRVPSPVKSMRIHLRPSGSVWSKNVSR